MCLGMNGIAEFEVYHHYSLSDITNKHIFTHAVCLFLCETHASTITYKWKIYGVDQQLKKLALKKLNHAPSRCILPYLSIALTLNFCLFIVYFFTKLKLLAKA